MISLSGMQIYRTKAGKISGTDFREIYTKARRSYRELQKKTKRRPYVRSAYFFKSKVFLELFWPHLLQKFSRGEKMRRLRYFVAAIELIQYSRHTPTSKKNPHKSGELLHRFAGVTREGDFFLVQIKEDIRSGEKWFMSTFPHDKE